MASTQSNQTIVVIGATGIQGSGVVQALLNQGNLSVRALTQNPNSPKARTLLSKYQTADDRLGLVAGQVYDEESLHTAFKGAYGVFDLTSERYPVKTLSEESELKHEIEAGRNIISAAKQCGIGHVAFSSLPDTVKASGGQFKRIHHMNNKHAVEQLAREALGGFTAVMPGFFYNNLIWPQYCRLRDDGVVQFCMPLPGDKPIQWTDPAHDMGAFVTSKTSSPHPTPLSYQQLAEIFHLGVGKTKGKTYLALGPRISPQEIAQTFTRITGKPAVYSPISFEEFGDLSSRLVGPAFKEDAIEMMQCAAVAPDDKTCYGAFELDSERACEELGVSGSSFEDWLRRSGWTGPQNS
ncbi:putative cinnamoyl-CoA reductase [Fusarium flagelliforme]|uniref:putative cinnamoyl-CoA reductase n=1 Tax=Fusarium flagelliforme TaxID=2675880 RepID=UPI001E8EE534|nr:putative cinnamoyl-CoA reductase [Fusarium flagelliforme]KAH7173273.1 putative cinnamoyl-CoA reductase [Fusarium flagelliforme]